MGSISPYKGTTNSFLYRAFRDLELMHTIVSMQIYKEWTIFQKKINSCSHMSHRFHVHRTAWLEFMPIFTQCQGNLNRCFWKSHITTLSTSKKVIFFLKYENIYPWRLLFYTIAWIWQTTALVMQTIYTIIAIAYTFCTEWIIAFG